MVATELTSNNGKLLVIGEDGMSKVVTVVGEVGANLSEAEQAVVDQLAAVTMTPEVWLSLDPKTHQPKQQPVDVPIEEETGM